MANALGFDIRYHVRGGAEEPLAVQQMSVAFERAGAELAEFGKHVFPRLIPVFEKEVAGQFDAEGRGPNRGRWQPLSPAYAKEKAKLYPGKKILERSGKMREGLTKSSSRFAAREYTGKVLNYGTRGVPYADFHQVGTEEGLARASRKRFTGLPDRPPFDFTPAFARAVREESREGFRDAVQAAGLHRYARLRESGGG